MKTSYKKVGDDYVITGQKRWITNGGVASFYTVFARAEGTTRHKGITCFVVDRQTPGVSVGKKENKMGQRCSNTTDVIFDEVKVGKANIVGPEGEGFKVAMRTFDRTRPWIAAGAAGIIRRSLEESRKYALERKTFGTPIAQHQAISSCWRRWRSPTRRPRLPLPQGGAGDRQRQARQHRLQLRQGVQRRRGDARRDRRRADLRRLRLHQGVPGREADARREAAADLRRAPARSSAWSSRATSWAVGGD
jgi:acyl-CoA dehydrogenase